MGAGRHSKRGYGGGKRGTPNKQVRKRELRQSSPRYRAMVAEREKNDQRLAELDQREDMPLRPEIVPADECAPTTDRIHLGPCSPQPLEVAPDPFEGLEALEALQPSLYVPIPPRRSWTLMQAVTLLEQGYRMEAVVARTGFKRTDFLDIEDLEIDQDGYLIQD